MESLETQIQHALYTINVTETSKVASLCDAFTKMDSTSTRVRIVQLLIQFTEYVLSLYVFCDRF